MLIHSMNEPQRKSVTSEHVGGQLDEFAAAAAWELMQEDVLVDHQTSLMQRTKTEVALLMKTKSQIIKASCLS